MKIKYTTYWLPKNEITYFSSDIYESQQIQNKLLKLTQYQFNDKFDWAHLTTEWSRGFWTCEIETDKLDLMESIINDIKPDYQDLAKPDDYYTTRLEFDSVDVINFVEFRKNTNIIDIKLSKSNITQTYNTKTKLLSFISQKLATTNEMRVLKPYCDRYDFSLQCSFVNETTQEQVVKFIERFIEKITK